MVNRRVEDHWTLDKRVPVVLICSMCLQCAVAIWWVSALNSRVGELERGADKFLSKSTHGSEELADVKERVVKLEINLTNINTKLDEIRDLIKRK